MKSLSYRDLQEYAQSLKTPMSEIKESKPC